MEIGKEGDKESVDSNSSMFLCSVLIECKLVSIEAVEALYEDNVLLIKVFNNCY